MVKVGGSGNQHPDVLANVESPAEECCPGGSIWTNLSKDEIRVRFSSGIYSLSHSGYSRCILTKSANQLIVKDVYSDITFDTENEDQGDMHPDGIFNDRILLKQHRIYFISYMLEIEAAVQGIVFNARIRMNDNDILLKKDKESPYAMSNNMFLGRTGIYKAYVDGFLTLQAQHNGLASLNVVKNNTTFMIQRLF